MTAVQRFTAAVQRFASAVTPQRMAAALATAGAAAVAYGIGMIYPAAGVIAAGLEALGGAYLLAYFGRAR